MCGNALLLPTSNDGKQLDYIGSPAWRSFPTMIDPKAIMKNNFLLIWLDLVNCSIKKKINIEIWSP